MKAVPVIAIFDIGKTNKKFFLIDESYNIVLERSIPFTEILDENGDACDDIARITGWIAETLTEMLQLPGFEIRAINFSTYGASLVYIDAEDRVLTPLYSYLKAYPEKLKEELYAKYGGEAKISRETASPVLGSLNSGMQLYRILKEKPALYDNIRFALHLPQYVSYLVTKEYYSDITSIGCHTQLWDFQHHTYHAWVIKEGLDKKLAPLFPSDKALSTTLGNRQVPVGTGLHDSSAALIPYLAVFSEPFILISTGTWCISLNPFNHTPLTADELAKDCLCYMGYKGNPVKAARLFAGNEHEQQVRRLADHFKTSLDHYKNVRYDASMIAVLKTKFNFDTDDDIPTGSNSSGFIKRPIDEFDSYEEAYHCLMQDIMQQQAASTRLVIRGSQVTRLFVDGGFGNNAVYMHLFSLAFPAMEVYAASVAQATAMGAALAIHQEWNTQPVPADMVKLKYYHITDMPKTAV